MHASRRIPLVLLGALIACALAAICAGAAPALAAPTVTVRIEGESATLLPATTVTLSAPEPVSGCPANSVAAAINLAVGGNWDHGEAGGGGGDFTETILGETHAFTHESDTWAEWVDGRWGGGICSDLLGEGDEVLMVADHQPPPYAPTVLPLVLGEVPAVVQAGVPFTVKASMIHTPAGTFAEPGQGTPEPAQGVTVSGGGASATTGAAGVATLTLSGTGQFTLRATEPGSAPSRTYAICVHNGNDGSCGTTAPASGAPATSSGAGGTLPPAPYTGAFALVASLSGLSDGHVYPRHGAPRLLAGTIRAHSAVTSVSLELRRRNHRHCSAYDATSERFRRARCGSAGLFKVASGATFSYLLPAALAPGRYVLDVQATDTSGNHLALARGSSRIVFYVR
ncbi:MAG TPA: hypothetical protein VGN13_10345 [Solirubrobacteraceae bacterium]|jgi:hypothetical protein